MKQLLLILFSCMCIYGFSQQKFEREYRVKPDKVPAKAKEFIKKCNFSKKVKWYAEESQDGKTLEAKSIKNKHLFSIEFDLNGNVLDVEKRIHISKIDPKIRTKIETSLSKRFIKFTIKKVQIHWQTDRDFLIELINGKGEKNINEFYEIILKGKDKNGVAKYEILLDKEGLILKELKFAEPNTDNLQF